jgi:hypothetical protein
MARLVKRRSKKAGLPPGTLVTIGGEPAGDVRITLIDYTETDIEERELRAVQDCFSYKGKPSISWINVDSVEHVEIIRAIGGHFGLLWFSRTLLHPPSGPRWKTSANISTSFSTCSVLMNPRTAW